MFPPFDKLVPEEIEQNAAGLDADDRSPRLTIIRSLTELRALSLTTTIDASAEPGWYLSLCRVLGEAPRPAEVAQATLNYVRQIGSPADAFRLFAESPRSLAILSRLACGSPFLTRILLREPTALADLSSHHGILEMKSREQFSEEAQKFVRSSPQDSLVSLRRYQHRELLRIGMCDAFGLLTLRCVTLQLSLLADSLVSACLEQACEEAGEKTTPLAVIALGKHGGEELNYSSDIDLLLVAEDANRDTLRIARRLVDALNDHLTSGFLYRVDLRLRPWGNAGPLVSTPESFHSYLKTNAELWEKQAMLRTRVIAGNETIGQRLLDGLPDVLHTESASSVRQSIRGMKQKIETRLQREGRDKTEVKLGSGSIRDVEFLVQSLQLIHGATERRLASANTLDALVRLAEFGLLDAFEFQQLRDGYIFLRTLEHALQLLNNQQTHEIPRSTRLRTWLAQRLDYPDADSLMNRFDEHRRAIRRVFDRHFLRSDEDSGSPNDTEDRTAAGPVDHPVARDVVRDTTPLDELMAGLTKNEPVRVYPTLSEDGRSSVFAVCAQDEPGLLSAVSGLLFGAGLDIQSGDVISGPGVLGSKSVHAGVFAACLTVRDMKEAAESVHDRPDYDQARIASDLQDHLTRLIMTRRSGGEDAVREELLRVFCERMQQSKPASGELSQLQITDYPAEDDSATVVEIRAADSAGLLFELANALNLCGYRIRRACISAVDGTVHDVLHITEKESSGPLSPARREEIHTAVTLIQQFTLWLPSSADPHNVLLRFRRLIRKLLLDSHESASAVALMSPNVLMQVAQVLGLSRHLWEDALLMHHPDVLPLLAHPGRLAKEIPADDLTAQLHSRLKDAPAAEHPDILDRFKDRHLFRVELRHVLGHCRAFGSFSTEVTQLAETVLRAAAGIAERRLREEASAEAPGNAFWVLAGLGKFGGTEMGFASDIELLLIYDSRESATATDSAAERAEAAWFEKLLRRTIALVRSRRDGIFEIDLRMRPWGQAGSAALSLRQFETYYGEQGGAWPYEQQALVKLRCVAGDTALSDRVHRARDRLIYNGRTFDFEAMQAMREQQIRQFVRPGTIHAKLSDGALVDCEYGVQALQITFGNRLPGLRSENTLHALQAANTSGLLTPERYRSVHDACVFLRQLIDCLRMVRGDARDLTVPATGTADYEQLCQRLHRIYGDNVSLDQLPRQLDVIRQFASQVQSLCKDDNSD